MCIGTIRHVDPAFVLEHLGLYVWIQAMSLELSSSLHLLSFSSWTPFPALWHLASAEDPEYKHWLEP